MKKQIKRGITALMTLALIVTSVTLPGSQKAKAAETTGPLVVNEKEYKVTSLYSSSKNYVSNDPARMVQKVEDEVPVVDEEGNPVMVYSPDIQADLGLACDYYKVQATFEDIDQITDDTNIVVFKPYNTTWGGWDDYTVAFKDGTYSEETGKWTAYVPVADVKARLSSGTIQNINFYFAQKEPGITVTAIATLKTMTEAERLEEEQQLDEYVTYNFTKANFPSSVTLSDYQNSTCYAYFKFTKVTPWSRVRVSASGEGSSNKAFCGPKASVYQGSGVTYGEDGKTVKSSAYILHQGYGLGVNQGTGIGSKGTGIYKSNKFGLNATKCPTVDDYNFYYQIHTKDTECELLGISLGSKHFLFNKETNMFEATTTALSTDGKKWTFETSALDDTDISTAEKEEQDRLLKEKQEKERQDMRTGLDASIKGVQEIIDNADQYQSVSGLAEAVTAAQAVYDNEDATLETYRTARNKLEAVRAKLLPVMSTEESSPKDFRILSKKQVISDMGAGINLGNTMDGHSGLTPQEDSWQAAKTTKAYIKALHDAGYNTVRVPVTWGNTINEDFSIQEAWMKRVQEIVDYCVDQDMYCIINIHHDGAGNHGKNGEDNHGISPECWLNTDADDIDYVYKKFAGTWKTIAERFKDYDEHLIFEDMNEVTDAHYLLAGQQHYDGEILENLNQIFVNTVRATGSNNTKRWLAVTGRFATADGLTKLPSDTLVSSEATTTRLMFAVHIYKDMHAAQRAYGSSSSKGLWAYQGSLSSTNKTVTGWDSNVPIYIGEYGQDQCSLAANTETGMNNNERALDCEFVNALARFYNVCPIVWDQGDGNYVTSKTNTGIFVYWNRPACEPVYKNIIEGAMRGSYIDRTSVGDIGPIMESVYKSYGFTTTRTDSIPGAAKNPTISEVTDITVDPLVTLKAGERTTLTATADVDNNNDVILWSTDDDSIVTVSQGKLRAKAAGITNIHAYTQSGSVQKDIKVVVSPNGDETATAIETDKAYYEVTEGDNFTINTTITPADSQDAITFTSSDPEIASVNSAGQVTGEGAGSTYIIVKAASGVSTIVKVKVNKKGEANTVGVTLNLLFNGTTTEKSKEIKLTGDGQYTLSYDLAKDLSSAGAKAGISKLEKLTAVYIRDTNTLKPVVSSASIRYDKVVVNDTELEMKSISDLQEMYAAHDVDCDEEGFKNLLKPSGQLDSNDPINGWDGSVVKGVSVSDHMCNFSDITNPTKISVTFTIKGMKFFPVKEKTNPATEMTTTTDNKIPMEKVGDSAEITLNLAPKTTDSVVTFFSTNSSVVAVDSAAQTVDAQGNVKINVTALSEGVATIVAITEDGLKQIYSIGVGDVTIPDPVDPTPDELVDGGCEVAGHSGKLVPEVKATEEKDGTKAYYECERCGKIFSDAACTKEITDKSTLVIKYVKPTEAPTAEPTAKPTAKPTAEPITKPTSEPTAGPTTQPTSKPGSEAKTSNYGLKVGSKFSVGTFKYQVTKMASQTVKDGKVISKANGTAKVVGLTKTGKKATKLEIADIVSQVGTYAITEIGSSCFKSATKLKSVTLNAAIVAIPKSAFAKCKKLTKITLNANLVSVKKGAFKGCKKKITVKGVSKKDNKKLLKKSGYKKFK